MTYGATSVNIYYALLLASEMCTVLYHDMFGFLGLVLWRLYAIQIQTTLFIINSLQLYITIWH